MPEDTSNSTSPLILEQLPLALQATDKECYYCKRRLPIEQFTLMRSPNSKLLYRNRRCNQCRGRRQYGSKLALAKKKLVEEAKNKPCVVCGQQFHPVAMDFDHLPPHKKLFNISSAWRWTTVERLKAEIAKCEIICACCHRVRTLGSKWRGGRPTKYLADAAPEVGHLSFSDESIAA